MKVINRTVLILSFVSLFADVASEMLYPVIPVYLKEIGFSVFSAVSKPMLAAFAYPLWIFFSRTVDRLGKGVRTAARDALLSQNATPETKARVFGFHRSMDTLGAAIGPALALLLFLFFPKNYVLVFLLAGIPGLVSVALIFFLKEERKPSSTLGKGNFFSFFRYWKIASPQYKRLVIGLLLLALFNSSDLFLLLKTKEVTGDDRLAIGAYILYNLVFAMAAYPLGALADKIGIRKVFMGGLVLFALVYFLFGSTQLTAILFAAFFIYGIYAAATEGITKAWISNLSHGKNTATAIGFYTSCESICTLLASIITGWLWEDFNSSIAFYITGAVAVIVFIYFLVFGNIKAVNN
ncbi:MAG: MFS transporter [Chitinophagaceae bacterium]|nr:MAG: MFS transporter [Chitinophagaceae bacterium]